MISSVDSVVGLLQLVLVLTEGFTGSSRDLKRRWPVVAVPGDLLLAWTLGGVLGRDDAIEAWVTCLRAKLGIQGRLTFAVELACRHWEFSVVCVAPCLSNSVIGAIFAWRAD